MLDVGLVVQTARKQGTVTFCKASGWGGGGGGQTCSIEKVICWMYAKSKEYSTVTVGFIGLYNYLTVVHFANRLLSLTVYCGNHCNTLFLALCTTNPISNKSLS